MAAALFLLQNLLVSLPSFFLGGVVSEGVLPCLLVYALYYVMAVHLSVLVPGILNQLNPLGLLLGSLCSGASVWLLAWAMGKRIRSDRAQTSDAACSRLEPYQGLLLILGMSFVLFLGYGKRLQLWGLLAFLVHPLSSWDVVSYHLPNAVNYLQAESLWPIQGLFSQYPGGHELISLWSLVPFQTDIMLGITYASQVLILGLMFADFSQLMSRQNPFLTTLILLGIYSIGMGIPAWIDMMFSIGRNDLMLTVVTLAAVWSIYRYFHSQASLKPFWIITLGLLLGMAVSIKPTGIPFAVLTVFFLILESKSTNRLLILMMIILTTGGFWYLRNLIVQGSLVSGEVAKTGLHLSIFYNLINPRFYNWNIDFQLYFGSLFIGLFFCITMILRPQYCQDFLLRLLVYFCLGSWLIMLITPYGASPGNLGDEELSFMIQLRYSTVLIPTSLLLMGYGVAQILGRFFQPWESCFSHSSFRTVGVTMHGVLALVMGIQLASYEPPLGLPGYDRIFFWRQPNQPMSDIYRWVHSHLQGKTIYSVGLRAYGLYGFPFSNRVIEHQGELNYPAIQAGFQLSQAQYLAISRDPFSGKFPEGMAQFTDSLELVYHDPLAGVFTPRQASQ